MNYYELIYLKNEIKNNLLNGIIVQAITPYKNLVEFYIDVEEESFRLIFSAAPNNIALFLDTYRPSKKSNKLLFFSKIYGVKITDISLANQDRILGMHFENGEKLSFKLFSNKANVLYISEGKIVETFKDHGDINSDEPVAKQQEILSKVPDVDTAKNMMLKTNPILPRHQLDEIIHYNKLEEKSPSEIFEFVKVLSHHLESNPVYRKLDNGTTTLLGEDILPIPTKEIFNSINQLIAYRFKNYSQIFRLNQQKGMYRKIIIRQIKRLNSVLKNLNQADKGIKKADLYEKYGHLLMANAHNQITAGSSISLNNLYDEGNEIIIPINEKLSIAENAEHYYNRASSTLKSYEEATQRIPGIESRYARLKKMESQLSEINYLRDLEDWRKKYKKEIDTLSTTSSKKVENNLPFFTLMVQGYQIWIGKNAKSNDKLVQLSHKEDIWMHARGVPGSHLIIRMVNDKGMPPKEVINQAASYAAFNSKAKGSNLVPVIVAKRKYVRKPKGAAPGAVLVQKEIVELVEPQKPTL